ncbi:MAG: FHA domain-containing protein [Clostridia bacterium]|nr:FHA domain-containing protein [Clostridia bacterium]
MMKKIRIVCACMLCAALLTTGALAQDGYVSTESYYAQAEATVKPLPANIQYGAGASDINIRTVQEKLKELGYYDGAINYEMDNDTMYAIKLFCDANQLPFSTEGITRDAYSALLGRSDLVGNVTPAPTDKDAVVYETLSFGQVSDTILNLQIRLKELGYYEGQQLTPQTYDWGFQAAVDAFCKSNNIAFDGEMMQVSESIQRIIFSEIAQPRAEMNTPAPTMTPEPTRPAGMKYLLGDTGTDIRRLQEKLKELGYYNEEITYEFDMNTLYALNQMCYENRLYSSEYGVSDEVWAAVFDMQGLVSITPVPTEAPADVVEYADLELGASGEAVSQMQIRLKELGFFTTDAMTLSVYDEQTQAAVELFCKFNNIGYQGPGISVELQKAIFSEAATPYSQEAMQLSFAEKMKAFFIGSQVILGIALPGYAWTLIAAVVVAGFAVALVLLLTGKPKPDINPSLSGVQSNASKSRSENSVPEEERVILMDVSIRFLDVERRERVRVKDHFTIGRSVNCSLVLDERDKSMSRSHCMLMIRGGNLVLKDASVNGTFVNDTRYHNEECVIHSGDRIQIGKHLLVVKF